MNQATFNIIISLSVTILVSSVVAVASYLFNQQLTTSIASFILALVIQFVGFYFWNGWLLNKQILAEMQVDDILLSQSTKQSVSLSCAYCRSINTINVNVNEENVFLCNRCNQQNMVMMEFSTAQVTVPQDSDAIYNSIGDKAEKMSTNVKDNAEPITFS